MVLNKLSPAATDSAAVSPAAKAVSLNIFRVTGIHNTYASAVSRDLLVVIFYGETHASTVRRLLAEVDTVARGNGRVANIITIVRPNAPMPERDARVALEEGFAYMIKEGVDIQSAVVFEGSGAKASIVRSVVTALSIITRSALPNKVFATPEEAARWHGSRITSLDGDNKSALSAIITELDARHAIMVAPRRPAPAKPG